MALRRDGHLNDTVRDINAVMEGFYTDGTNCYERFIPAECTKVKSHGKDGNSWLKGSDPSI